MAGYDTLYSRMQTPQSQPIPGSAQVPNKAGGFAWAVGHWQQLDRFLILGSAGGTYYVEEQELTRQNMGAVEKCIAEDLKRTVDRIVEVSDKGLAPKNDPALFALAAACALAKPGEKAYAYAALPAVARIGTHLFHFVQYRKAFGGEGSGYRRAVARWYDSKSDDALAAQLVKYQQRDGWSHRDVLRTVHPRHRPLYRWAVKGDAEAGLPRLVHAFEMAKGMNKRDLAKLIVETDLPRESVPTEMLNEPEVWAALLENMPMTSLMRNLGKMGSVGLLKPLSQASLKVQAKLADQDAILRSRLHPLQILIALAVYAQGHGERGSNIWPVVPQVVEALNSAFYSAFRNAEPTGRRILLAVDGSGSMEHPCVGSPISCRAGAAALAMVTARTEPQHHILSFTTRVVPVALSPRQRLDDAARAMFIAPEGTDCGQPFLWAMANKVEADAFVVFTDNETWAGAQHPAQALAAYRQRTGIPATLIVVAMAANQASIVDPNDAGSLEVIGFDASVPQVIHSFIGTPHEQPRA
ncbi:MAG: TROVE domain-containing protein [Patescibacteria group bacterium]|nr:TROVE domain-containing protein [Patescibacteria group bacterium]